MVDPATYRSVLYQTQLEFEQVCGRSFKNLFISVGPRYFFELQLVEKFSPSKRILEVGAAPFVFTVLAKKFGYQVTGLDFNPAKFQKIIDYYGLDIRQVNIQAEKFPFDSQSFEYVHFSEVFEHLYVNPFFTLLEINRVLTEKGILLLGTPNFYSADNIWRCLTGRGFRDAFEEFSKIWDFGYPGHIREYTHAEVVKFLNFANFSVKAYFFKYYRKSNLFFLNVIFKLFPKLRPYQVFICEKT